MSKVYYNNTKANPFSFTGPLASVLVSLFGCRKVAIFGAILAGCSFFACTWAPNVIVMILVYGLLGGKSNKYVIKSMFRYR